MYNPTEFDGKDDFHNRYVQSLVSFIEENFKDKAEKTFTTLVNELFDVNNPILLKKSFLFLKEAFEKYSNTKVTEDEYNWAYFGKFGGFDNVKELFEDINPGNIKKVTEEVLEDNIRKDFGVEEYTDSFGYFLGNLYSSRNRHILNKLLPKLKKAWENVTGTNVPSSTYAKLHDDIFKYSVIPMDVDKTTDEATPAEPTSTVEPPPTEPAPTEKPDTPAEPTSTEKPKTTVKPSSNLEVEDEEVSEIITGTTGKPGKGEEHKYFGKSLKIATLGADYKENESGVIETDSNVLNESAKFYLFYPNFKVGDEITLTFDIDYLLNPDNKVTDWREINVIGRNNYSNDTKYVRVPSTVRERLEGIFEGKSYDEIHTLLLSYQETRDPKNELFENEDFLKFVPVGVSTGDEVKTGGLNEYNWFNLTTVGYKLYKDEKWDLAQLERDNRIIANKELNINARNLIRKNGESKFKITENRNVETNKLLLKTEKEKAQGYSDTFNSIFHQFNKDSVDDVGSIEDNFNNFGTFATLDDEFNLHSKGKQGIVIDGEKVSKDNIINYKNFDKNLKPSGFKAKRLVYIVKTGVDSSGKSIYKIHNLITNHFSKQKEFKKVNEIFKKFKEDALKGGRISVLLKDTFRPKKLDTILTDLEVFYPKKFKDNNYKYTYDDKIYNDQAFKSIPDLRSYETYEDFKKDFLDGDYKTIGSGQLLSQNVHTNIVYTKITEKVFKTGKNETIYTSSVQPLIEISNKDVIESTDIIKKTGLSEKISDTTTVDDIKDSLLKKLREVESSKKNLKSYKESLEKVEKREENSKRNGGKSGPQGTAYKNAVALENQVIAINSSIYSLDSKIKQKNKDIKLLIEKLKLLGEDDFLNNIIKINKDTDNNYRIEYELLNSSIVQKDLEIKIKQYINDQLKINEENNPDVLEKLLKIYNEQFLVLRDEISSKKYDKPSDPNFDIQVLALNELLHRTLSSYVKGIVNLNANVYNKNFSQTDMELSLFKSLSADTKMLFTGIKNYNFSTGFAGLGYNMDIAHVIDAIMQILSQNREKNLKSIESTVEKKVTENESEFGFLRLVYDRLKNLDTEHPAFLKTILFYSSKSHFDMEMTHINKIKGKTNVNIYDVNFNNYRTKLKNTWTENLKNNNLISLYGGGFFKVNKDEFKEFGDLYTKMGKAATSSTGFNFSNIKREHLLRFLHLAGITLNDVTIDSFYSQDRPAVKLFGYNSANPEYSKGILNSIYKNISDINKSKDKFALTNIESSEEYLLFNPLTRNNTGLDNLIELNKTLTFNVNSSMRVGEKTIQPYESLNLINKTLLDIKSDNFEKNDFNRENFLLKLLESPKEEEQEAQTGAEAKAKKEVREHFGTSKVSIESIVNSITGKKGKRYNGLTPQDKLLVDLSYFGQNSETFELNGIPLLLRNISLPFPTLSDSVNTVMLNTTGIEVTDIKVTEELFTENKNKRLDSTVLGFLTNELIVPDMRNMANNKAISEANISGLSDGTKFFNIFPTLNTLKVTVKKEDSSESESESESGSGSESKILLINVFKELINISNNIENTIGDFLEVYGEDIHKEIDKVIFNEVTKYINLEGTKGLFIDSGLMTPKAKSLKIGVISSKKEDYFTGKSPLIVAYDYIINSMLSNRNILDIFGGGMASFFPQGIFSDLTNGLPTLSEKDVVNLGNEEDLDVFKSEDKDRYDNLLPLQEKLLFEKYSKVYANISKRLKSFISSGNQLPDLQNEPDYTQIIVKDVENSSKTLDYLIAVHYPDLASNGVFMSEVEEFLELDGIINKSSEESSRHSQLKTEIEGKIPKISDYLTTASTDAQEYTSYGEHLHFLRAKGSINNEKYDYFNKKFKKQVADLKKSGVIKKENKFSKDDLKDIIFQPIKPLTTGIINEKTQDENNNTLTIPRHLYVKSSSYPLLPELGEIFPEIKDIILAMETVGERTNGLVRIGFQTATKVGGVNNPISISDLSEETFNLEKVLKSSVTVPRSIFFTQSEKPIKGINKLKGKELKIGSQINRLILGGGVSDMGNIFNTKFFDPKLLKDFNVSDKNGLINGRDLQKIKNKISESNQSIINEKLFNDLGIDSPEDLENGKVRSMELYSGFLRNMISDEQTKKLIDLTYLDSEGNEYSKIELLQEGVHPVKAVFKTPLTELPGVKSIENTFNSSMKKKILASKLPGNSFVVASENSYTIKGKSLEDLKKIGFITTSNFNPEKGLLGQRKDEKGNVLYSQVFIPNTFVIFNQKKTSI